MEQDNKTEIKNQNIERHLFTNAPCNYNEGGSDYDVFSDYLEKALTDKRNRNIGIIGDYGSGKSSAIKNFKDRNAKNKKRNIITISLAEYCNHENNDSENKSIQHVTNSFNNFASTTISNEFLEKNQSLQFAILQQLFNVPNPKNIRFSKFVNYKNIKARIFFWIFLLITITLGLLGWLGFSIQWLCPIKGILLVCAIISLIPTIICCIFAYPIKHIKAKTSHLEIDIDLGKSENLFDTYLSELIYFFKQTKYDLVIFEDIDRIKNCERLFTQLSTLNYSLNNCVTYENKAIVFLYAIKENIFTDGDMKSKFFDILLPIRPVLTPSSATYRIKEKIEQCCLDDYFSESFIELMGMNVSYYRQLNNIFNAFNIIKDSSKTIDIKNAQYLMAMLIFKSNFPLDYMLLIKGKGILYGLLINGGNTNALELSQLGHEYNNFLGNSKKFDDDEIKGYISEIKKFWENFSIYLNLMSIDLISSYPKTEYTENDRKFLMDIENERPSSYPEFLVEDIDKILQSKIVLSNLRSPNLCTFQYLDRICDKDIDAKYFNEFVEGFSSDNEIRNNFISECIERFEEINSKNVVRLLQQIVDKYNLFNNAIVNKIGKNRLIQFLIINVFSSWQTFNVYNTNNNFAFSTYLNTNKNAIEDLLLINSNLFNEFLNKGILKIISLETKSDKYEKIKQLIWHSCFDVNAENLKFINTILNKGSNNPYFISHFVDKRNAFDYIFNECKAREILFSSFLSTFAWEDATEMLFQFKHKKFDSKENLLFNTCPQIIQRFDDIVLIENARELMKTGKLSGTINAFAQLKENNQDDPIVTYVCEHPACIVSGKIQSEYAKNIFIYKLANPERNCPQSLIAFLFENCFEDFEPDFYKMDQKSPFFEYALSKKILIFDNTLLAKITDISIFKSLCFYYKKEICNHGVELNYSVDQLQFLISSYSGEGTIVKIMNNNISKIINNNINVSRLFSFGDLQKIEIEIIDFALKQVTVLEERHLIFLMKLCFQDTKTYKPLVDNFINNSLIGNNKKSIKINKSSKIVNNFAFESFISTKFDYFKIRSKGTNYIILIRKGR